ncbi:MAG: metallophosphoesterase [Zoogloeaceae bacterium]|nr:metallophosphoesterase [Zoogloeaceae bacterium]
MRSRILPWLISSAMLVPCGAAQADASPFSPSRGVISLAVFGDSPYGTTPTDTAEFDASPSFIDAINADPDVSLVLHVGDIHSGKQYCTEAYDRSVYELWTAFQHPLIYTPGDNEWTDCHKTGEGGGAYNITTGQIDYKTDPAGNLINYAGGDPIANLDLVRSIFFAEPGVTLAAHKVVLSQAQAFDSAFPSDEKYVENVMWAQSQVLFVSLNVPGGSNNDADAWYGTPTLSAAQVNEREERTGADLRWLDAAFDRAQNLAAKAMVIQLQADMWDQDGKAASHIANYQPFIDRIAARAVAFGKPVLLLNGDSHAYRSDNPLADNAPCVTEGANGSTVACGDDAYDTQAGNRAALGKPPFFVPNFHRVVVHGSTFPLEWLKLTVNPRANAPASSNAFGPFSWQRMTLE